MSDVELGRLYVGLEGRDLGLTDLLTKTRQQMGGLGQTGEKLGSQLNAGSYLQAFKSGLIGIVGPAAVASAAIGALRATAQSFRDAFNFKAELDATTRAINTSIEGVRNSNQVWKEATEFGNKYLVTQKETNDILKSSTDILRVSSSSVGELEANLLRLQSRDVSKPISEAARALRELQAGDTTSIKELFNVPAKEANKMKAEILAGGDAVKVLGAYLDRAGVGMEVLENRAKGTAGALNQQAIAAERLALAQAKFAEGPGLAATNYKTNILEDLTALFSFDFSVVSRGADANRLAIEARNKALEEGKTALEADAAFAQVHAQVMREGAAAVQAHAAAGQYDAGAMDQERQSITETIAAAQQAYEAHKTHASALEDDAAKALVDAANSDELSFAKQRLKAQAEAAAAAVLAGGGNIEATAARLAASSSLVDQLTSAYIRLAAAQNAANAANVNAKVQSDRAAGRIGRGDSSDYAEQDKAFKEAEAARQAAYDRQVLAVGKKNEKLAVLERQYNDAVKQYGATSAQAIDAQTELLQERQLDTQKKGGAARLSDAQKFNNQNLSLQDKYADDSESREREHQRKLADIEKDGQERRAAQERRNEVNKRANRADFYDQLLGQDFDTSKFAAAYEQAFQKAQEIAQQGNHKLSEDYLAMRQRQIQADEEYERRAQEIQKSDLSKGEKQRKLQQLEELRKLRADANAEEEKQLVDAGDQLNNDLAKQLADENQRYQQATDEAGAKFDALADRRIAAYQRANKTIAGIKPAELTNAPAVSADDSQPAAQAPKADQVLAVHDDGVVSAINGQTAELAGKLEAIKNGLGSVERAIGRININQRAVQ